jgi:hypothetical protein
MIIKVDDYGFKMGFDREEREKKAQTFSFRLFCHISPSKCLDISFNESLREEKKVLIDKLLRIQLKSTC